MDECAGLLAKDPKQVNHLEVNIRHLVKQKKAQDEFNLKVSKLDQASNAIIASLKSGELLDPENRNVPFSEQTITQ